MILFLRAGFGIFAIASLAGAAWAGKDDQLPASSTLGNYIEVAVADSGDRGSALTVTWSDTEDCSDGHYASLRFFDNHSQKQTSFSASVGSASSDETRIHGTIPSFPNSSQVTTSGYFLVSLYCWTGDSARLVSSLEIWEITEWEGATAISRMTPGSYSTRPPMTALSISKGALSPAFSQGILTYTITGIASSDMGLTFTPTFERGYTLNPAGDANGILAGYQKRLNVGANTITITAGKQDDRNEFTYTFSTNRPEPTLKTPGSTTIAVDP